MVMRILERLQGNKSQVTFLFKSFASGQINRSPSTVVCLSLSNSILLFIFLSLVGNAGLFES